MTYDANDHVRVLLLRLADELASETALVRSVQVEQLADGAVRFMVVALDRMTAGEGY